MFTSRRILINNEIQFREASSIRFKYNSGWQSTAASNGTENFTFYFKKGENTVTFETVLGDMTDYVYRVEQLIDSLNAAYKEMLQLTGPTPDAYRDYGFNRLVPDAVQTIRNSAVELYTIADELKNITGELGDQVATLNTIAILFETMGDDEYEIAPNFVTFKNYIIALSNWLYAALNQPLKIDYFTVQGEKDPLPKAKSNFFESIGFEIKAFIGSFYMDYTTVDFKSDVEFSKENTVEAWITSALGRDDALITRNLVDTYFTPESGITVKMKVITTGLTEAILAGIGPDIATMSSVDTITWGLRNAVEALDEMDGFDEVMTWVDEAAVTPLQMTNAKGEFHTYGLPQTLDFYMMFYRADVLKAAGVEVPKTWQDLKDILPALRQPPTLRSVCRVPSWQEPRQHTRFRLLKDLRCSSIRWAVSSTTTEDIPSHLTKMLLLMLSRTIPICSRSTSAPSSTTSPVSEPVKFRSTSARQSEPTTR